MYNLKSDEGGEPGPDSLEVLDDILASLGSYIISGSG